MSAATRQAIAAAANTVTGISCTPYHRQSLKPGDGCVRLANRKRSATGFGYVDTWQVWVALAQNVADAEKWLDDHTTELADALEAEISVQSITPAQLQIGAGAAVNGVIVEGAREG
ncbi:MAG TPA: hypothetical protein VGE38_08605 [Nocardioides sp.]|uniref:hypothetical protein n=1 Tax=Nocardioides sp. TaxID=35761 RepID=UPI002ED9C1C4